MESIALFLYYCSFFKYFGEEVWARGITLSWFNLVYLNARESYYFTLFLSIAIGWLLLVKLFHTLIMLYCSFANLTLDEVLNPPLYPYLYRARADDPERMEYWNPDSVGPFSNFLTFIRQGMNTHRQLE